MANTSKIAQDRHRSGLPALTNTTLPSHQDTAPYLDQSQQSLLIAALNSQAPHTRPADDHSASGTVSTSTQSYDHMQPQQAGTKIEMDNFDNDFTPDLLDFDDSFDFDDADLGGQMIGALPDEDDDGSFEPEQHEKRKNSEDDTEGGDYKRQETLGGEKGAKKPGRKPLTSEPTTKRKAQNRAAQRAFRERKEAHLKDLETKVSELTKSKEADKHENGLLRAQVDRLQTELRDYRKRLSLNSSTVKRSPPLSANRPAAQNQNFQFKFPKFRSLPTAAILGGPNNSSITPPLSNHSPVSASFSTQSGQPSRHNSEARSMSPATQNQYQTQSSRVSSLNPVPTGALLPYSTSDNMHGFASTLPQMGKDGKDPFGDLFSPSILKSVTHGGNSGNYFTQSPVANTAVDTTVNNGGYSTAGIPDNRVFRFNSTSVGSDSASPSMSSLSQGHTANSSCGTSPEPVNDSPGTKLKSMESVDSTTNNTNSQFSFTQLPQNTNDLSFANLDAFNVPQVDTFDPVLFGEYRDTNENIVGGGDFTGGFFDDGLNSAGIDWGTPSNLFGILSPAPAQQTSSVPTPSHNLMAECDKARDGGDDDYGLPGTQKPSTDNPRLISCTKIWSQLQSNSDFQDGKFDLDGLCSELRKKARCSESGLMIDSEHVDQALKKMANNEKPSNSLMFEQESWDNVMKKFNAGKE